ncbi:MAG TPA: DUF4118 domain-containing protein, partial [Magnetospirillum sp.]|nr:DUF4118 domain-containing protein [Magnetospirillum sp.]
MADSLAGRRMGWLHGFSLKLRGNLAFGLAFALAAVGGSLAVRLIVEALLPPGFPFITFFPSVMIVTYLAGLRPGILAAVLSVLAAWYFFIPPADAYGVRGGGAVAFFILVAAIDIAIIHAMRIALDRLDGERRRSAELSRQSQVMFAELQHRVSNNLQLVSTLLMIGQSKVSEPLAV